ncbi:uncharacterized protein LOC127091186 [Lathyrus oleraceus]|uniref:uncharacterized protein LOC127091186 n=1 Tax=Pisum sativum TaxID=3888 RepID=UPI0021D22B5C|nr:uncharacterized protein LOC127091186 [Pisum sativum]
MANQKSTDATIKNLETQVGQLSKQLADQHKGTFSVNTQDNPKEHCKSIQTCSGRKIDMGISDEVEEEEIVVENEKEKDEIEVEKNVEGELVEKEKLEKEEVEKKNREEKNKKNQKGKDKLNNIPIQNFSYPHAPSKKYNARNYVQFLNIFSRLQIKIPFFEALEQMPTYAKLMKDILTKKRRYKDQEIITIDASYSAIIQRTPPWKESSQGRVTLSVFICNEYISKALIDLGSTINLILLSVVQRLGNIEMKSTKMTLQLADKSRTRPHGIIEDVLIKVDKFFFPIDFVVINMEEDDDTPLIIGRPFMKTARMKRCVSPSLKA